MERVTVASIHTAVRSTEDQILPFASCATACLPEIGQCDHKLTLGSRFLSDPEMTSRFRSLFLIVATLLLATTSFAAPSTDTSKSKKKEARVAESARAQRHMARLRHQRAVAHRAAARRNVKAAPRVR